MEQPVHKFKCYVIHGEGYEGVTDYWYKSDTTGWLYTKVKDIKGVEIAEGDIVDIGDNEPPCTVRFFDGAFWLDSTTTHAPLLEFVGTKLEVVGHVMDKDMKP